jgi:hypothetical protein
MQHATPVEAIFVPGLIFAHPSLLAARMPSIGTEREVNDASDDAAFLLRLQLPMGAFCSQGPSRTLFDVAAVDIAPSLG